MCNYTVHQLLYTVHCTLYTVHCTIVLYYAKQLDGNRWLQGIQGRESYEGRCVVVVRIIVEPFETDA